MLQEYRRDILRYLGMPEAATERSRTIEAEALLNREHDTLYGVHTRRKRMIKYVWSTFLTE